MRLQRIVRALRHRNYRLFSAGQSISLIGTWMQRVAMSWLVYRLTGSALLLGVVNFTGQAPTLLFTPFAGVIADRYDRHRLLIATQVMAMVQAALIAVLVLTHVIAVWHLVLLSLFLGIVNAFDTPIRQSMVVEMIENREDLSNAIALNSSMVNGARLVGPSIAGILIATVGEGMCFLLNAVSYVAVIMALMAMTIAPKYARMQRPQLWQAWREGVIYVFESLPIRSVLLLLAVVSFMGMPYATLLPIFAQEVLHGGAQTLGFLMGAAGIGALAGAMFLASRDNVLGLETVLVVAAMIFGGGLIAFSQSRVFWLSLGLMIVSGFGMMVHMAASNTLVQTFVDDDKRGRVMSLYTMSLRGMVPLGSLLAGGLASHIGAPATLTLGGICCVVGACIFASRRTAFKAPDTPEPP
ncbi:MAG: MFS transporter [Candidatus Entotheonellia bacterium]